MQKSEYHKVEETKAFIRSKYSSVSNVGIILGSGLGNLVRQIDVELELDYREIPHFPVSTVEGHSGKLYFGKFAGKKIIALAGRFHYYEGYSTQQVVYPVRLLKSLGVTTLFISNAAGAVNQSFSVGDIMVIRDHISFFTANPLIGPNEENFGPRFPDMSEPYKRDLIDLVKTVSTKLGIPLKEGVYTGVTGPTFETRAEYKLIQLVGGDAVGMSTVQEVIAAVHMHLPVLALSVITDIGIREDDNIITHEEVLQAAAAAEPKLTSLILECIASL